MKDIERLIANIQFDVDTGWDFFKAVDFEAGFGIGPGIQHVELGNGVDAITSRCAEGFSCEWWDLETVHTLAREFNMKVVVLKKHDCDSNWNMANDFDTDGLEIMPKFSTMFYDEYNQVSYALGLIFKED